jgi:hypothetical protein
MIEKFKQLTNNESRAKVLEWFKENNKDFPSYPRGIWYSEMFAFLVFCEHFFINTMIESGIYKGQSTEILHLYFPMRYHIYSIDRKIEDSLRYRFQKDIKSENQVSLIEGDSCEIIPEILDSCSLINSTVGILLDGPKGKRALDFANKFLEEEDFCSGVLSDKQSQWKKFCSPDRVAFIALHDTFKESGVRKLIEKDWIYWSTDEKEFVEEYQFLDMNKWEEWLDESGRGHKPYIYINENGARKIPSYGPTLTFLFKRSKN